MAQKFNILGQLRQLSAARFVLDLGCCDLPHKIPNRRKAFCELPATGPTHKPVVGGKTRIRPNFPPTVKLYVTVKLITAVLFI